MGFTGGFYIRLFYFIVETMFDHPVTRKIADFLLEIGLKVEAQALDKATFLPGILIKSGVMIVDETKLKYPGDLLHEAAHLAVAPGEIRGRLDDEVELPGFNMDSIEAGAIAWSYAAALHLGLQPAVVFHEGGYKGKSEGLLMNFSFGVYVGLHVLEEAGMAVSAANPGETLPFPNMIKWLRD